MEGGKKKRGTSPASVCELQELHSHAVGGERVLDAPPTPE